MRIKDFLFLSRRNGNCRSGKPVQLNITCALPKRIEIRIGQILLKGNNVADFEAVCIHVSTVCSLTGVALMMPRAV